MKQKLVIDIIPPKKVKDLELVQPQTLETFSTNKPESSVPVIRYPNPAESIEGEI